MNRLGKDLIYLPIFVLILLLNACTNEQSKTTINELSVQWKLERNFELDKQSVYEATFQITNNSADILSDNWVLYWNQSPRTILSIDSSKQVEMQQINGDYYQMQPITGFELAPYQSVDIKMTGNYWMIKEADGPVGVYVVFNPGEHQTIKAIEDFRIAPFTKDEQVNRGKNDQEPIPTAVHLFEKNKKLSQLPSEQWYKSIPAPSSYIQQKGIHDLRGQQIVIACSEDLRSEAQALVDVLDIFHNLKAPIKDKAGTIELKLDPTIKEDEGYRLSVRPSKIEIIGKDKAGVFYGIQTLSNLVEGKEDGKAFVQACEISDAPAYAYRGLHIDVSRNFQSKETILKMIDVLATYKINKLVFCITEDEGWRIEIDGLPELTEVGSKRGHPTPDGANLEPAYGSGPFVDGSNGTGFYTRADYKEIIQYAHARHVDIIPLVNFPGHARAAVKAMEYRYHRLMKAGKEKEALEFRLADPDDTSEYRTAQQYNDNVACVCQPSAFNFYKFVVEDIIEMYEEANVPLYMFHTGGDEVPNGPWKGSPICQEYLKDFPDLKDSRNLQAHFFGKITNLLQEKNIKIAGWEEVVMAYDEDGKWYTNTAFVDQQVHPNIWNNLWGLQDLGYKIANRGYPIILCNVTNFYFDLAYDKDPREPGLYWGGFNNTQSAFNFIPENLFLSTTHDAMGGAISEASYADQETLSPVGKKNIFGLQAQLWSETVRGQDMFEYYILPKLMGFAQRAWEGQAQWGQVSDASQRNQAIDADWNRFANTLSQRDFPNLEKLNGGFNYRIPAPGIQVKDGKLAMNSAYPGMQIRFTTDGSQPTMQSSIYEGPIDFSEGTVIAKVFNGSGRSGLSSTYSTDKELEILD